MLLPSPRSPRGPRRPPAAVSPSRGPRFLSPASALSSSFRDGGAESLKKSFGPGRGTHLLPSVGLLPDPPGSSPGRGGEGDPFCSQFASSQRRTRRTLFFFLKLPSKDRHSFPGFLLHPMVGGGTCAQSCWPSRKPPSSSLPSTRTALHYFCFPQTSAVALPQLSFPAIILSNELPF